MTKRQRTVLDFIKKYWSKHKYAPSYEEIRVGLGMTSKSGVKLCVDRLVRGGWVTQVPHQARSVVPTDKVIPE
mgnify:CR=1 FL=1|jgi:SOS-response transcriptional repressor LexA|tara:strand:+ start:5838 stop:6056 length:219 start_codon:yes stop_codon:yes gene_type:complete